MRRILTIGILLTLAIFSLSFSASAIDSVEISDIWIQEGAGFGPGSECPLYTPFESGYVWVSDVEPVKAVWTIYTPFYQPVYSISHRPSYKVEQADGTWHFADRSAFTIPAFASKGNWLAKCVFEMADGSKLTRGSAENPNIIYMAYPVTRDDPLASIFTAPWFFFGFGMPPYFFVPGFLLWVPLIYIAFCAIFSRSIGGFVDMTKQALSAGREARRKLKRTKKPKKRGKK